MKKSLMALLLIPLMVSLSSCNKEESVGKGDFDGDGIEDEIIYKRENKNHSLYYVGNLGDTISIVKNLKYAFITPTAYDINGDGHPDVLYNLFVDQTFESHEAINNGDGTFKDPEELKND